MNNVGNLIQQYRKANNLTQSDLAARMSECGYPIKNGAISTWELGSSVPNANQFLALCQILNITDIYNTFINEYRKIPLRLMSVSAGMGEYVTDDVVDDYIETTNGLADYALRINGDSMEPEYWDGDIILVQNTEVLSNGDVGVFYLDGNQYCKRLRNDKLVSTNPKYEDIDISVADCFRILGKVLGKHYE